MIASARGPGREKFLESCMNTSNHLYYNHLLTPESFNSKLHLKFFLTIINWGYIIEWMCIDHVVVLSQNKNCAS